VKNKQKGKKQLNTIKELYKWTLLYGVHLKDCANYKLKWTLQKFLKN